jgi:hypothetical protein
MRTGFIFDPVSQKSVYVVPSKGDMRQPAYSRGPKTRSTSNRLLSFRSCIQQNLSGKHPGSRAAIRSAFASAAHACAHK